jgi:hypothetical protein
MFDEKKILGAHKQNQTMANEEFYVTVLALVLLGVILYAFASSRYSPFAVPYRTATLNIQTKTGTYKGVNDLIAEYAKNYASTALYREYGFDQASYAVSFKQIKNSKLSSKDVMIVHPYGGPTNKYSNRETKNSLWNTDRPASSRLPEFIALLGLHPDPATTVFTPGVDTNASEYTLYIATKTYDRGVQQLVDLLNEKMKDRTILNPKKSQTPLPVRIYAVTVPSLSPADVVIYENDSITPIFKTDTRATSNAWQLNVEPTDITYSALFDGDEVYDASALTKVDPRVKVDSFNKLTDNLLMKIQCPKSTPLDKMYPPSATMCDEKVNHCYLLQAYANESSVQNCLPVPKRLEAITTAYNEAVSSANLIHPGTKKPVRFYNGGATQIRAGGSRGFYGDRVFAAIDKSKVTISESNANVDKAMQNNDYKAIQQNVVKFLKLNMSNDVNKAQKYV